MFPKTVRYFEGSKIISAYFDFFDKIISAWFAKSDFIAYSHVFQVIIKLKYRFMKN